jgi:hypothetical protein
MTSSTIQAEALAYLQDLVVKYEQGTCWITKNKAINMRYIWDVVRENYFGAFKKPKDRFDQDKIFYPLTETMVWENVKNIDVDTKDINTKALHPDGLDSAVPVRYIVKDWMYKSCFGETLNKWLMYYALDGHLIVKTIDGVDEAGKQFVETKSVDLRNCFYDVHAEDIHKTPFIERSIQDATYIKQNFKDKKWINLDKIQGSTNLPRLKNESREFDGGVPEVEMYEYWGKIKQSWITGKAKDDDIWVNGRIYASNLSDNAQIHFIEATNKRSPYEDVSFEDAPNRHPGRGVGEKVMFLQIYLNTLYNIRRNNNLVMMNQLFKFRNGSGVTPQQISNLVAGGAIGVSDMDDFERIDTRNLNFSDSLNEETNLVGVANRVTSNQEAASGEAMPASTPATNAIIQNQAVKSSHQLRQERFGLFLSRLFTTQLLPRLIKLYKNGSILQLGADNKLDKVKKNIADYYLMENIKMAEMQGQTIDPLQLHSQITQELSNREQIFIELQKLNPENVEVEFFVTDEGFDKNTILQNLQQVLFNYSQFAQDPNAKNILREIFDILGIDANNLLPNLGTPTQQTGMNPMPGPQTGMQGVQTPPRENTLGVQANRVNNATANA